MRAQIQCKLRFCFFAWIVVVGFFSSSALGQTVTGSITGIVTDPSDAVVVGARVTAENTATSVKTSTKTNASGVYTISFLPIVVLYYPLVLCGSNFAKEGKFHPALDCWAANGTMGVFAIVLFRRLLRN